MPKSLIEITFSGKQLAVLTGASVLLCSWPFEQRVARQIVMSISSSDAEIFTDEIGRRTREHFSSCGLWPVGHQWTQALITRRGSTSATVSLRREEIAMAVAALRVSALEFTDRWWEFFAVAPGGLEMYGVTPTDLLTWATDFELLIS